VLEFLENDIQKFESFNFVISLLFKTSKEEDNNHLMSTINKIIPVSIALEISGLKKNIKYFCHLAVNGSLKTIHFSRKVAIIFPLSL
jgi:hypothetical protein